MPESASARIAARMAAQKATNGVAANGADDEVVAKPTKATKAEGMTARPRKISVAEKAKAAREARAAAAAQADAEANEPDEDEDDDLVEDEVEAPQPKAKAAPKLKAGTAGTGKGGKKPSPAQLAARAAFAARSKAAAAERRGEVSAPPVQTAEDVKSKQNATRKAERAEAAAKADVPPVRRQATSKPKKAVETQFQAKARVARERIEAARIEKASGGKVVRKSVAAAKAAPPAPKAPTKPAKSKRVADAEAKPQGESKAAVLKLWAQGKTRNEISEATGLSYAAVFHHTKGVEGTGAGKRGRIFVDIDRDEKGRKLRNGKTVEVSRSEAMRRMYLGDVAVGDIARHFDVLYSIAYTAVRPLIIAQAAEDE